MTFQVKCLINLMGGDLDRIASREVEICEIKVDDIIWKDKQRVGYSVERGQIIVGENDYQLIA